MKNKLLSLLTLLTICVASAWAETVVTDPATEMVDGTYITLQCMDTNGGDEYYFNGNAVKSQTLSYANIYKIVSNGADAFYLQRVSDEKYVGKSGDAVSMVDEASSAAPFTFSIATASNWTTYDNTKYTNGTSTVRFTTSGTFLNTQGLAIIPKYAAGQGGYSIWYVKTYTQNEVDKKNPELLTFSEVKDGYTYAIVNVQPSTVNFKKYYLNNNNGELTPVDATDFNNASEWDETAQFVAVKQAEGKFAFKNKANNQYLAWRSHGGRADLNGENGNKGFVDAVADWSTWTMNKSTRENFVGTYYPTCPKRNASTTRVSTLLIANDGTWNAWGDTECTTNNGYSNNYGFVELAAPTAPEYTITFNFTGVAEGTLTATVREGNVPALPVAIPSYVNYTVTPELAAVTGDATYTVNTSYTTMPFTPNNESNYNLNINRNPNLKVYTEGEEIKTVAGTAITYENQNNFKWQFEGDWLNGFKLKNKAAGKYVTYGSTNPNDNSHATLTDAPAEGAYFDFIINGGKNYFKIHGTTNNAYISNFGGAGTTYLTNWNSTANIGDAGAQFIISEAQDIAFDLTAIKEEAIASLPTNVSVLYTEAARTTATNTINAVSCGSDQASIDAALAAISTAKENYMKSAEGKMFSIKSTQGTKNYVDAAGTTLDATSTTLKVTGVYEVQYVEGTGQYKLHVVKNDTYVKNNTATNAPSAVTSNAEEAGVFFIGNVNENDNEVYFAKILSGWNAIHYNSNYTGHNCVWTYDAGASQWTIESISDEQWAEMTALPDVTALQTLIDNTRAGYYDDWNGVWRITDGLNNYHYITEPAEGMDLQTYLTTAQNFINNLTSDNTDEEVAQYITNINSIIANLSINQPADGSFLRIRSVKAGMGYVNGEASTAHDGCLAIGDQKASSIFYYTDGKLLSYTEGQYIIKNNSGSGFAALGATGADGAAIVFGQATKQAGCYTVIYNGNRYLYAADNATNTDAGGSEGNNGYDFWLEEVTSLPVSVSAAGYATLYAPVALEVPTGVTAYTLTENGNYLTATEINGDIIPANTGVILKAEEGTYNFNVTTGGEGTSCLKGVVPTKTKSGSVYTLANGTDGLGFYNYTGATLKGFRAYFEKTSGARGFVIDFGGETGIVDINDNVKANKVIYNLAGQRVSKAEKGIYIINGKKVLK